jgi:hypothetical protein
LLAEDVCVELLLELLVGEVDAELLERVRLEVLEAEDVEDADERGGLLPLRLRRAREKREHGRGWREGGRAWAAGGAACAPSGVMGEREGAG